MLKITYNRVEYSHLRNPLQIALLERAEGFFLVQLAPFQDEIYEAGGKVYIDVPPDFGKVTVQYYNMPVDLKNRVRDALSEYIN